MGKTAAYQNLLPAGIQAGFMDMFQNKWLYLARKDIVTNFLGTVKLKNK